MKMILKLQIKPNGSNVDSMPTFTLTLISDYGLHTEFWQDHHEGYQSDKILSIEEARGKWIQVLSIKNHKIC